MYRMLIYFLLQGVIIGVGLAVFLWIGRYRWSWQMVVGVAAALLLANMVRLVPLLNIESKLQQLLREAGDDRAKIEAIIGRQKQRLVPWDLLIVMAFFWLLALAVRLLTVPKS